MQSLKQYGVNLLHKIPTPIKVIASAVLVAGVAYQSCHGYKDKKPECLEGRIVGGGITTFWDMDGYEYIGYETVHIASTGNTVDLYGDLQSNGNDGDLVNICAQAPDGWLARQDRTKLWDDHWSVWNGVYTMRAEVVLSNNEKPCEGKRPYRGYGIGRY